MKVLCTASSLVMPTSKFQLSVLDKQTQEWVSVPLSTTIGEVMAYDDIALNIDDTIGRFTLTLTSDYFKKHFGDYLSEPLSRIIDPEGKDDTSLLCREDFHWQVRLNDSTIYRLHDDEFMQEKDEVMMARRAFPLTRINDYMPIFAGRLCPPRIAHSLVHFDTPPMPRSRYDRAEVAVWDFVEGFDMKPIYLSAAIWHMQKEIVAAEIPPARLMDTRIIGNGLMVLDGKVIPQCFTQGDEFEWWINLDEVSFNGEDPLQRRDSETELVDFAKAIAKKGSYWLVPRDDAGKFVCRQAKYDKEMEYHYVESRSNQMAIMVAHDSTSAVRLSFDDKLDRSIIDQRWMDEHEKISIVTYEKV